MERLFDHFRKLLDKTDLIFLRYAYHEVNWENRMIGITGPRGVGKTTMVLQRIKKQLPVQSTLYVTTEDFYFAEHRLLSLAENFVKQGGKFLFIDEIHQYADWAKELKLIYDYFPDLHVVFTGSSVLDIKKGASDLSRRAVMYHMQGLSFREYLQLFHQLSVPVYTLSQILSHQVSIPEIKHPLVLFKEYLNSGYYPFSLDNDFDIRLMQIVNQTLEKDIPMFAEMNAATGRKLKQLLAIIAKSVPFKPNFTSIAEMLSASRNNIADYCLYIEEAGMIFQLRNHTSGIRGLGKVDKIYLDNTNLTYVLAGKESDIGNIRETFFLNQVRVKHDVSSADIGDFQIDDLIFEVGGKNKSQKQVKDLSNAYIVKDDLEFGFMNSIPLWHFGLLY
ncbi:MAG: ATP-binding protein [Pedobacter sp.]|nr:MAG: ATP-binding protein [Pedobacter sp.]